MSLAVPPPLAAAIMPLEKMMLIIHLISKQGVTETLMKNFYADDLLESAESEDSPFQLREDARKICQHDGFNLSLLSTKNDTTNLWMRPESARASQKQPK